MADESGSPQGSRPARGRGKRTAPVSRGSAAYPRKRSVAACQVCRARRTKCDQKKPSCSFCTKLGVECTQDPSDLSAFDPASLAIIERLQRLEQKLDAATLSPGGAGASSSPSLSPSSSTPASSSVPHSSSHGRALPEASFRTRGGHTRSGAGANSNVRPEPTRLKFTMPENLDGVLRWQTFQDLAPTMAPASPLSAQAPSSPPWCERGSASGDELDPAVCSVWLDSFFGQVHVKNPILDEEATRRLVRRVCLSGAAWDDASCLALLVCANGALVRPFGSASLGVDDLPSSAAMALFAASQKRLGRVLVTTGVVQAQCVFLTGVFLMALLRPVEAWHMFVHALALCQSFVSVRHPLRQSSGAAAEQSIYWSCWKSEQELRRELAVSRLSIPAHDPPQLFPSLPEGCEGQNLRAWYFYLSEISLWRLETETRQELGALAAEGGTAGVPLDALREISERAHQQVIAWRDSLAPWVSIAEETSPALDEDSDVIRFVLRGRTTYVRELISWPFVRAALNGDDASPTVREWATRGLAFHLERLTINRPGFYHRHHGTWLMLRSSARSACVLLAFARVPAVHDLLPNGWQEAVEATVQMLYYWRDEAADAGETANLMQHILTLTRDAHANEMDRLVGRA